MGQIRDYLCSYDSSADITLGIIENLNLPIPEVYQKSEYITELAIKVQEKEKDLLCRIPFCHTLEGEALGGNVNFGNNKYGPRAKDYICKNLQEVLELPPIDVTKGRIAENLKAAKQLKSEGKEVVFMLSGPFTILNMLINSAELFRGFRKEPEIFVKVLKKLGNEVLKIMSAALESGVNNFSYADSAGAVNIIGPKMAELVVEEFTYDFVKGMEKISDENTLIFLCPKTALALIGMSKAEFVPLKTEGEITYTEACLKNRGKVKFVGQTCIKSGMKLLKNSLLQEVRIE